MVQWFRTLIALAGLIPITDKVFTTILTSAIGDLMPQRTSANLLGHQAFIWCTYRHAWKTHKMCKSNKNFKGTILNQYIDYVGVNYIYSLKNKNFQSWEK
jgi:hypothetical protein